MTWQYQQSTGQLQHDGVPAGIGYSGHGVGLDAHSMEAVRAVGPIPCGLYKISAPYDDGHLGTIVMNLDPVGHDADGRSLFRMHGDNALQNFTASDGCIVMARDIRTTVANSGDQDLEVIA